jgi:hypothetical protein
MSSLSIGFDQYFYFRSHVSGSDLTTSHLPSGEADANYPRRAILTDKFA